MAARDKLPGRRIAIIAADIPSFNAKMLEAFAEGKHAEQRAKTTS